jgi:hypothetical protein
MVQTESGATTMPQYTLGDRLLAIEFMLGHLFWTAHGNAESVEQLQQRLRGEFASAVRANDPQLASASEALEALDHLFLAIAATRPAVA